MRKKRRRYRAFYDGESIEADVVFVFDERERERATPPTCKAHALYRIIERAHTSPPSISLIRVAPRGLKYHVYMCVKKSNP